MSIFVLTQNKHIISIIEAQLRNLAKHIEAHSKKHNAYKKKNVYGGSNYKESTVYSYIHNHLTVSVT